MRSIAMTVGFCLVAGAALAQAPPAPPKPGPEVQKLAMFAGKWTGESDIKPSPFGPGGKMTSADDCTWFEGGFQLVCQGSSSGAMGSMKGTSVMGWNANEKAYKWMGYDSVGMMSTATGTVSGKTWTWSGSDKMGDKNIQSHYIMTETSPTSYDFKWEMSEDGKTWKTIMEGKSTKKP
jgi:hypothetical protein